MKRLIDIPAADPDETRRRQLLNIVLISMAVLIFITVLFVAGMYLAGTIEAEDARVAILGVFAILCLATMVDNATIILLKPVSLIQLRDLSKRLKR